MTLAEPSTDFSNTDLILCWVQALNRREPSALRQMLTQDSEYRFPDRSCHGPDEIVAYFQSAFDGLPDWSMDVRSIGSQGDDVYMHWHLRGTHGGPLLGIDPTGRALAIDGLDHFVVRDGKVVSNFVVFDQMQYARQIGMMPPDGSAGDKALKAAFNARTKVADRLKRRS